MINGCYKQYSLQLHEEIITLCCKERKDSQHFRHRMFSFDTVLHLSVNAAADQKRRKETGASRSSHLSLYVISNCRPTCECKHPEVAWKKDIWLAGLYGALVNRKYIGNSRCQSDLHLFGETVQRTLKNYFVMQQKDFLLSYLQPLFSRTAAF